MSNLVLKTYDDVRDRFFPGTPLSLDDNFRPGAVHDKVVAYIPARSGSTRVKHKNIRTLGGIPLIAYTILMAKAMKVDRIILDTDCEEYARIGKEYGSESPFLRPQELSGNKVSPGLASYYATRMVLQEGYPVGVWIDMYPTSPFRSLSSMQNFMNDLMKAGTCTSINMTPPPQQQVYRADKTPLTLGCPANLAYYKPTGTFIGYKLDRYKKYWRHYRAVTDPIELIDIDTPEDHYLAEQVLRANAYDFGIALC